ncbi:MAG: hypothetical protein LBT59_22770 [Clostridiales bacterium]|jgi:hypothetical protein|nr:hypothetical protein [Clostridiales bacterium]
MSLTKSVVRTRENVRTHRGLKDKIAELERELVRKDEEIKGKERELEYKEVLLKHKDGWLEGKNKVIASKDEIIRILKLHINIVVSRQEKKRMP